MEKENNKLEDINVIKDNNIKQKTDDLVENNPNKSSVPDYSFTNLYSSMVNPIKGLHLFKINSILYFHSILFYSVLEPALEPVSP